MKLIVTASILAMLLAGCGKPSENKPSRTVSLESLESRLTELESENSDLKEKVEELESQNGQRARDIGDISAQLMEMDSKVRIMETDIRGLEIRLNMTRY